MFDQTTAVESFQEIDFSAFTQKIKAKIQYDIEYKGKEYILSVDENEFISFLINKYTFELINIDIESEEIGKPAITKETLESRYYGENYGTDVYNFTIIYNFSGSPEIFKIRPTQRFQNSYPITINETRGIVSFSFKVYKPDPEVFNTEKDKIYSIAFRNLVYANKDISNWNTQVEKIVTTIFNTQKKKYLQENDFFTAINVKVNPNTVSLFTPPTIKKKIIPQPSIPKNREFSSEPTMSNEMYNDVLKVIYDSGKNMEKKPALYQDKNEEGLRDQFLFVLETRYEGTTATGETFNRSGKTDIILKYAKDGSNLFVAECKFWNGSSNYQKAISQLFDKYLTWRDSKVALIIFVTNQDFTNVLQTIRSETMEHPYYLKMTGERGESSFSFLMYLPQDHSKQIFLEVLSFHYDKIKGSH
jgi:hypothetical protein